MKRLRLRNSTTNDFEEARMFILKFRCCLQARELVVTVRHPILAAFTP